ncbi:MAG: hypothetical protein LBH64_04770, partial [Coriobacteriales bacterium]|nr:hypothetical protein [Coriobacteriales bacterium]
EQLTQGDVDERSDLWALAILLYQMLTGSNPFYAQTTDESLRRILDDPLPLPSALRDELDPLLDEVLVTALMADKHLRFSRVADFAEAALPLLGNAQAGRRRLKRRVNERDEEDESSADDPRASSAPRAEVGAGPKARPKARIAASFLRDDEEEWPEREDGDENAAAGLAPVAESTSLWGRLPSLVRGVLARLVAAAACGCLGFTGLSGFGLTTGILAGGLHLDGPFAALVGTVMLIALAGFFVPQLGSALACVALVAGIIARGSYLVGGILAVALACWWLFYGRKGRTDAALVALTPLLGTLGLSFALPLLAGYFLPWRRALAAAAAQGLILITLAILSASSSILTVGLMLPTQAGILPASLLACLTQPLLWLSLASLLLAALLMSLFASRKSGLARLIGLVLGSAILALPCALALLAPDLAVTLISGGGPGGGPGGASGAIGLTGGEPRTGGVGAVGVALALSFILLSVITVLDVPPEPQEP